MTRLHIFLSLSLNCAFSCYWYFLQEIGAHQADLSRTYTIFWWLSATFSQVNVAWLGVLTTHPGVLPHSTLEKIVSLRVRAFVRLCFMINEIPYHLYFWYCRWERESMHICVCICILCLYLLPDCQFLACRDHAALVSVLQENRTNRMYVSPCISRWREREWAHVVLGSDKSKRCRAGQLARNTGEIWCWSLSPKAV